MTPAQQVVSRELAHDLAIVSVPQQSLWRWIMRDGRAEWIVELTPPYDDGQGYAAFTLSEMIAWLGGAFGSVAAIPGVTPDQWPPKYIARAPDHLRCDPAYGDTLEEAVGRLLLLVWETRP